MLIYFDVTLISPPSIRIGEANSCTFTNFFLINYLITKNQRETLKTAYSLWLCLFFINLKLGIHFPRIAIRTQDVIASSNSSLDFVDIMFLKLVGVFIFVHIMLIMITPKILSV